MFLEASGSGGSVALELPPSCSHRGRTVTDGPRDPRPAQPPRRTIASSIPSCVPASVHIERLSDKVGLGPCLLKIPIVLRGRLALVSLFSPGEVSALFVHDYWSRQ